MKLLLSAIAGLTSANFFYQAMYSQDWRRAAELTLFQVVAVVVYALSVRVDKMLTETIDKDD